MDCTAAEQHYEGQDLEALADLPHYQDWLLDRFRPHLEGRVVEIGAGIGNLARQYVSGTRETVLIEPAPNLHPRLKERFASAANVRVLCATLERAVREKTIEEGVYDSALLINVLEHIPDDVALLRSARPLLRPGGALLLFVPALPWLYGSLDRLVHHERRYTSRTLRAAVTDAGFRVESMRYFDMLGVLPWLVAGRVVRVDRFDERSAQIFDRFVVPVGRAIEARVVPRFGKNLSCVCRLD
jgi:SAM-dependent methyltransferase